MVEIDVSLLPEGKHGNDQVQGKSCIYKLLIINSLMRYNGCEFSMKACGFGGKRLDWEGESAILALGSEEC
jgi:hypothetical protein